jgi:predicted XRE-type DNA-binding protein
MGRGRKITTGRFNTREELVRHVEFLYKHTSCKISQIARNSQVSDATVSNIIENGYHVEDNGLEVIKDKLFNASLKIRTSTQAEFIEVQKALFTAGCGWFDGDKLEQRLIERASPCGVYVCEWGRIDTIREKLTRNVESLFKDSSFEVNQISEECHVPEETIIKLIKSGFVDDESILPSQDVDKYFKIDDAIEITAKSIMGQDLSSISTRRIDNMTPDQLCDEISSQHLNEEQIYHLKQALLLANKKAKKPSLRNTP